MNTDNHKPKLTWSLTAWQMNGRAGWTQQPVILVEGRVPFFADHPNDYVAELQRLHDNPEIAQGPFYTLIGQLQDAYEQAWKVLPEMEVYHFGEEEAAEGRAIALEGEL